MSTFRAKNPNSDLLLDHPDETPWYIERDEIVDDPTNWLKKYTTGNDALLVIVDDDFGIYIPPPVVDSEIKGYYYVGNPEVDGTWRMYSKDGDFTIEKRVFGQWIKTTKVGLPTVDKSEINGGEFIENT